MEIDNLKVEQSLPVISFDYDTLRQWAISITDKYKDLVVTENDVKTIKKEMADLNKAKDKLNRARIDTVKAISAPIKEFEAQIKDVCGLFDATYSALGEQVKAFENREREEKRNQVEGIIEVYIRNITAENPDLKGKIALSVKDRWMNKSMSIGNIKTEIKAEIDKQIAAEREIRRIEQQNAERRLLIENAVKTANEKYGVNLPVSKFMEPQFTSLDLVADGVLKRIDELVKLNAEMKQKQAEKEKELERKEIEEGDPEVQQGFIVPDKMATSLVQADKMMIRFTAIFSLEQEDQVREILNQNQFMRIKRQLDSIDVHTIYEKITGDAYLKEVENG